MMEMKSPRCLISTGTLLFRRLCAAVAAEKVAAEAVSVEEGSLYRKLSILRGTGGSVTQTLEEYSREGRIFRAEELERCVKSLRKFRNYPHALEILDWMETKNFNFTIAGHTWRLDLIAETKGIAEAEKYFNNLSPDLQDTFTYGSLLNSYCKEKMQDKALDLFKKMDDLNMASTTLVYDSMISLHMKLGNFEKVFPLIDEMKKKNIPLDTFTYNAQIQSYASINDIEGSKRILEEIEKEDKDKCNWTVYSNLAVSYVKAGQFEKAESALKKVETTMKYRERLAYHYMISLYASTSNLSEVKRVWSILKLALPKPNNISYLVILQALAKLDDIEGLKECYAEWRSISSGNDMRLTNTVIKTYLKHSMIKEAELLFDEDIPKKASRPFFNAHEMLMNFFLKNRDIDSAMKHMEETVSVDGDYKWSPDPELMHALFTYFEETKDVDGAEKLCEMLKKINLLDSGAYQFLLRTYVTAGKTAPDIGRRMENGGIKLNSELEKLLESVVPK